MARAARDTRIRKGNMILVIRVVSSSFPGTVPKSGAMTLTISGENHHARHDQQAQEQGEAKDDVIGQSPGLLLPQTLVVIGENRDESGAQSPFGKQVPEQVGNPEGDNEGVKGIARAKKTGKDLFPHQPQNPAGEDRHTHRPCGPGDGSRLAG